MVVAELINKAREHNTKIACAESCTGGLVGAALTEIPGSADVFNGSAVTYSNEAKQNILGVSEETLKNFGAVSEQCATEMANGALRIYKADLAVSITGIAGPDGGSESKPVGTVCFGIATHDKTLTFTKHFSGTRKEIRECAINFALNELMKMI